MWGPDIPTIPPRQALFQLCLAGLMFVAIGVGVSFMVPERPCIPRQYPYNGLERELGGPHNRVRIFYLVHYFNLRLFVDQANPEPIEDDED